ncbi:MAG: phage integrase SAM-like domain-containing protein, partial [Planctomycetes bacterium]|nr:phage integrase SAM-like domain-containing protein [Planctomycetota bacterium]
QYAVYNDHLERLLNEAQTTAIELKDNKRTTISAEAVKFALTGRRTGDFFSFADTYINNLDQEGKFWEWKKARVLLSKLKQFEGSQELAFEKLDYDYLISFEKYMREELGNATNTIWKNMQIFHRILKHAIRSELLTPGDNPFLHYTSKTAKTVKEKLSIKEIEALKELDLKSNSALWNVRNYFLFSFYCAGIRFGVLRRLRFRLDRDGEGLGRELIAIEFGPLLVGDQQK